MDPYEILGVSRTSSREEVAEAYRALAQIYHPDRYASLPERVQAEAEKRMKQLSEAYEKIKRGVVPEAAVAHSPPTRRSQWPKPPPKDTDAAPADDAVGVPAEPLPAPVVPYSKGKWDAALRHWTWSERVLAWECEHGKDVCQQCGATPDKVALESGAVRPPFTWRRSPQGAWICIGHRKPDCLACGGPPDKTVAPNIVTPKAARAKKSTKPSRVRWS